MAERDPERKSIGDARDPFDASTVGVQASAGFGGTGTVDIAVSGDTCRDALDARAEVHGHRVLVKVKAHGKCHVQMNWEPMPKSITTNVYVQLPDGDYRIVVADDGPQLFVHWENGAIAQAPSQDQARSAWAALEQTRTPPP
jgi:hypothetical protein